MIELTYTNTFTHTHIFYCTSLVGRIEQQFLRQISNLERDRDIKSRSVNVVFHNTYFTFAPSELNNLVKKKSFKANVRL